MGCCHIFETEGLSDTLKARVGNEASDPRRDCQRVYCIENTAGTHYLPLMREVAKPKVLTEGEKN